MCLPWGHNGATLRTKLNLCFLRPTRVHNPNGKLISSAIFAQLMAECHRAYWRHLANTTELVLPSAHTSPQPKRQIAWFSHFCTAHGGYLTMGDPFPKNYHLPWGSGSHLTHDSLGPSVPTTKMASRSVHRFCTDDRRVFLYFTMGRRVEFASD